MVPGDGSLNSGGYLTLENELLQLSRVTQVELQIEAVYNPDNLGNRPDEIIVRYQLGNNGIVRTEIFPNESPSER